MSENNLKHYLSLFESLDNSNINHFDKIVDQNIYFLDPFNEAKGLKGFKKIFNNTINNLQNPKFKIIHYLSSDNKSYVKWHMTYFAFGELQKLDGISEIKFNQNGKIFSHIDYWDSYNQFYIKLPYIGKFFYYFLKILKKKI